MHISCTRCELSFKKGIHFCPYCGSSLQVVCSSCGRVIEHPAHFCPSCGANLDTSYSQQPNPIEVSKDSSTFQRMNRKPYFLYSMGASVALSLVTKICAKMIENTVSSTAFWMGVIICAVACCIFTCFSVWVTIRRSHDLGKSAWFAVLGFIPIVSLYFFFKKGTTGANPYGPDPLKHSA